MSVAGASFILPAAVITGAFAWAYVRSGALTQAVSALVGIKAAVIAVIAIAIANRDLATGAVMSLSVLLRWKASPAWVVLGGGVAGLVLAALR